jgi:hypothetical protein
MSDPLAVAIYQSIHEANEPRVFKHSHASSIADCPRAHYFKRQGVKPVTTPTAAKMLRWQAGHIIEEVLRPHLLKLYPDLKSNIRMTSEDLDLTGEYDNYSHKERMIIEIKSVHNNAPYYLEKEGPYLSHEYQNHAYVLLLAEALMEVKKITYIYVTLDGRILTFLRPVQEKILMNVKKRLKLLKEASEDNTPACICDPDHPLWKSTMQWCDYRDGQDCCDLSLLKEKHEDNSKVHAVDTV